MKSVHIQPAVVEVLPETSTKKERKEIVKPEPEQKLDRKIALENKRKRSQISPQTKEEVKERKKESERERSEDARP